MTVNGKKIINSLQRLLWPLACLYDLVTSLRNVAFDRGWIASRRFPCATIAVGNLAVGGTGKTPHAEYLLRLLSSSFRVALLSRGYGRRSRGFVMAKPESTAAEIGDEPLQVFRKYPNITVAVDEKRCEGLDRLLAQATPPQVVVLDDAFQHRYVTAGLYILLTDYSRLYVDEFVLPAGRLRESHRGARRAQVVVVTKCPPTLDRAAREHIRQRLGLLSGQKLFFTTFRYGLCYPLFSEQASKRVEMENASAVLALTGIARPEPLYDHLSRQGVSVTPLRFPDHHAFTEADVVRMNQAYAEMPEGSPAITTEKDAARLWAMAEKLSVSLRSHLMVQPVEVAFVDDFEEKDENLFIQTIYNYVTSHQTNR